MAVAFSELCSRFNVVRVQPDYLPCREQMWRTSRYLAELFETCGPILADSISFKLRLRQISDELLPRSRSH